MVACTPDAASLSGIGMNYAVQLRLKTGADPNSWGIGNSSQILYWNGTAETPTYSRGAYPIFIVTSLGAKGDARSKIIAEMRGNSTFLAPNAALYVNGNLTKNGTAGSAIGSYNVDPPDCPAVADVITTPAAAAPNQASDWPADTSDPAWLVDGGSVYSIDDVVERARKPTTINSLLRAIIRSSETTQLMNREYITATATGPETAWTGMGYW